MESVLFEIRSKTAPWSWKRLSERRQDRRSYVKAYKTAKLNPKDESPKKVIEDLEHKISLNDIIFYRSLGEAEFKKENPDFGKKSGFLTSLFGVSLFLVLVFPFSPP